MSKPDSAGSFVRFRVQTAEVASPAYSASIEKHKILNQIGSSELIDLKGLLHRNSPNITETNDSVDLCKMKTQEGRILSTLQNDGKRDEFKEALSQVRKAMSRKPPESQSLLEHKDSLETLHSKHLLSLVPKTNSNRNGQPKVQNSLDTVRSISILKHLPSTTSTDSSESKLVGITDSLDTIRSKTLLSKVERVRKEKTHLKKQSQHFCKGEAMNLEVYRESLGKYPPYMNPNPKRNSRMSNICKSEASAEYQPCTPYEWSELLKLAARPTQDVLQLREPDRISQDNTTYELLMPNQTKYDYDTISYKHAGASKDSTKIASLTSLKSVTFRRKEECPSEIIRSDKPLEQNKKDGGRPMKKYDALGNMKNIPV